MNKTSHIIVALLVVTTLVLLAIVVADRLDRVHYHIEFSWNEIPQLPMADLSSDAGIHVEREHIRHKPKPLPPLSSVPLPQEKPEQIQ